MSDSFKKVLAALKEALNDIKKKPSLKSVQNGFSKVYKSVDLDKYKAEVKELANKAQKDISAKTGVDVDNLSKKAQTLAGKAQTAVKDSKSVGVPMKFPYTFSAKIAHFPWMFYFNNNWIAKYYVIAILCSVPLFAYLSALSKSPENVKKWKELKKAELEELHH